MQAYPQHDPLVFSRCEALQARLESLGASTALLLQQSRRIRQLPHDLTFPWIGQVRRRGNIPSPSYRAETRSRRSRRTPSVVYVSA